jgi:hypothetical protein
MIPEEKGTDFDEEAKGSAAGSITGTEFSSLFASFF